MDVLSSRLLLHPRDHAVSRTFYEETLGLGVFREFGTDEHPGIVFFIGSGLLELSGHGSTTPAAATRLLLQVRDLDAEFARLRDAGVPVVDEPERKPWGLLEATLADPDGLLIVLVQIPEDHPQRLSTGMPLTGRRTAGA